MAGYERLRRAGGDWQVEAGEVLLSELSCLACHRDGPARVPPWRRGPDLSAAGNRLRASYVREFLADPAAVEPGTTMPNLTAAQPQPAELVEDLTHYVMDLQKPEGTGGAVREGSVEKGRELFRTVGCVACHGDVPMQRLGEKYAPGQLERFLEKPLKVRPDGRMPDLHLAGKEAAHLAAYLAPSAPKEEAGFKVDDARASRGRKAFASLGCESCHVGRSESKARAFLDPKRGCLSAEPPPGVPVYALAEDQRTAIRSALAARRPTGPPAPRDPNPAIRRLMLQYNCFACHIRGGLGGPAPEVAVHFTSTRDDLGDLGRLPPPLDGVGRKFQPAALESILRGRDRVRTYMRVRMPDFGEDPASQLAEDFARADADPHEAPSLAQVNPSSVGRNEWGRESVGTSGYACIACHDLHGHASLGLGAYDLAEMPKRLRPEWMRDFLLNPAAFPTGARMPLFWPEGKPVNPKLGGGKDAERQIDGIRVYLTEVDQSLPPEGFADRAAFELKPAERPIIFRTFIDGIGTHAIAVGFPGGVNVAFDALATRWALAWRGRFLDADGTWNQRFAKLEKPLGEDLVRLEAAGALAVIGRDGVLPKYRGYRVGEDGVPVFLYGLGALRIEDRFEPGANRGLKRTLRVSGQTTESVQFNAQPPAGLIVQIAGGAALPAQLAFREGWAELVEEIAW
ncbi:MAG: hypothetical protein QOE70_810 [Chthoniobacter sp.]|nr:hypothetical protein [Chthoniobacter sp.]